MPNEPSGETDTSGSAQAVAEVSRLRRVLRDVVAFSSPPALGTGLQPHQIAEQLAEGLISALRADLVYVCLEGWSEDGPLHSARAKDRLEIADNAQWIGESLRSSLASEPSMPGLTVPDPLGPGTILLVVLPIGPQGKWGKIAVCARRVSFPTELDRLLLNVAANQVAIALRQVSGVAELQESEHRNRQLNKELDDRVGERTAELRKTVQTLNEEIRAREQSERTARAQESVLIRTMEQLTQEHSLEEFPGVVLAAIVEQLGAIGGSFWVYYGDTDSAERTLVHDDEGIAHPEQMANLSMPRVADLRHTPGWVAIKKQFLRGEWLQVIDPDRNLFFDPETRAFLALRKIRKVLVMPLLLRGELRGYFRLWSTRREEYGLRDLEIAQSLAHQATLSLQWTQLADQARNIAVQTEREQVASVQVAELVRVHQALLNTLDALADAPELERLLGTVIAAVTEQLGANSSALWLFDWEAATIHLHLTYEESHVLSAGDSRFPQRAISIHEASRDPQWTTLVHERRPVTHRYADGTFFGSEAQEYLANHGATQSIVFPLALGDDLIGLLSTRLGNGSLVTPEKVALSHVLAHQATLAIHLSRLTEQARHAAVLEERNRMAREIHDTLAQAFTGILLQLASARRILPHDAARGEMHLQSVSDLAREGLTEARRSVQALRPQALEDSDLAGALGRTIRQLDTGEMPLLEFHLHGTIRQLRSDVANHLLRIGQEAITNALRYSGAATIQVHLTYSDVETRLVVEDDGKGLDQDAAMQTGGYGLRGMRERTELIGADLTITSDPGHGTRIEVCHPTPRD